jgi:hypothetical protein
MIKSLIQKLFFSDKQQNEIINDLKNNPNFRTKKEIDLNQSSGKLEKGKVLSILLPDLGNQKELVITKWYVTPGDVVNSGDIVCTIENENITMEFETFYSGKIISICKQNQELTIGKEVFKIEGV